MPAAPPMDDFPEESLSARSQSARSIAQKTARAQATERQKAQLSLEQEKPVIQTRYEYPELAPDGFPQDGFTRFDWRDCAMSQQNRSERQNGRWLYPSRPFRVQQKLPKLAEDHPLYPAMERYEDNFVPLLTAEMEEEMRIFEARLKEWTIQRLVGSGYALEDTLATFAWSTKQGGAVYKFAKKRGAIMAPRFNTGTYVLFSRTDPNVDPLVNDQDQPIIATVRSVGNGNLFIAFDKPIPELTKGQWRLDIGYSDFVFQRQFDAVKALSYDPLEQDMAGFLDERDAAPKEESRKRREQGFLQGTALREPLFRSFLQASQGPELASDGIVQDLSELAPTDLPTNPNPQLTDLAAGIVKPSQLMRNDLLKSWAERYRSEKEVPQEVEGDPHVPLNRTQLRAIGMMLSQSLSLVQGPPGTGKTRVIVETIKLLKQHFQVPHPILVCAHTNVAVDNLLTGLDKAGLRVVRVGTEDRVPGDMKHTTLEARLEEHPMWDTLNRLEDQKMSVWVERKSAADAQRLMGEPAKESTHSQSSEPENMGIQKRHDHRNALGCGCGERSKAHTMDSHADMKQICTTCISAATRKLQCIDFPIVFLDEASMATEPLSLIPLMKGSSHVSIIGDHKQLPPVIISEDAHSGGLSTSLFERLIHEGHVPSIMLDTQYRMHPALSAFPSKTFYSSLLQDGTPASARPAPKTAFLLADDPVADPFTGEMREVAERKSMTFLSHEHQESAVMKSLANYGDAELVVDIVADLLHKNPEMKVSDIGIITPYLGQIKVLQSSLYALETREKLIKLLGEARTDELGDIEIKTVDGFEGREKEVIIFSTVRCNSGGYIGFLGDWRRVNVGLTRAKRALIMVGNKRTLSTAKMGARSNDSLPQGGSKVWKDFMAYLEEERMILDVEE
ncbi:hypothetical protein L198_01443 [Cryptococcus wingfieldii CBS 7118]|uniref:P-loop containing nucleoside triphosphate hydrolase protein n=1 Tax=Cryptococcus wingfieldii CBS 7118 TaxID=1295528 RepID=A0A1E3JZH5_9TREE|nr:hypothetical protein L198_01443 [Cryptococcus wingfieldii CBS 7118]ODO06211.1 hypothetical protein L198_01443 [Cryptococcus wingfieldii CBS 7118]